MEFKKNPLWVLLKRFLKDRFELHSDKADDLETIEYIKRGVEFRGTNLWILIFAIFTASIGLNVNSTAVIIGAMLISPLMGPIMGIGMGVGIYDLDLLKRSFKNLIVAVGISVLASTLYFAISPLSDAQSELLARTTPTIWDVFIALFGGLAGIVASTRKEKSTVIPGVAIATALMPPLCTAGYGLATLNPYYFFGAFYLFFINSVFISLSTFLIVRFLRFPKVSFVDHAREKRVRTIISLFVVLTITPSIYLGYNVVMQSIFERNARNFITTELNFDNARVIGRNVYYDDKLPRIEVTLFGERISDELIEMARRKLDNYQLKNTDLIVFQGYSQDQIDREEFERMNLSLRSGIIEELYRKNEEQLIDKDRQIRLLESELTRMRSQELPVLDIAAEVKAQYENITEFSLSRTLITQTDSMKQDTIYLAYAKFKRVPNMTERKRMENWLKARIKSEQLSLVIN
ncbi:MAG TPA: TIGR00341 family protein [Cyclobacteriaceae bacterium]|nr:TIGR00341 family protein [Cyclobacteriaceae bacterium]